MIYPKFSLLLLSNRVKAAIWLAIITMLLLPAASFAATAVATVLKNTVELDEPFELIISVDDNINNGALNLTPLSKNFNYSSPQLSNSTSILNGTITRQTQWRVVLIAKKKGRFTIPSFDLNGLTTLPIIINVSAPTNTNQNGANPNAAPDVDAIQITASLNRNQGYVGETFTYDVRLMIGTRVESPSLDAPFGDGLKVEQIGDDVQGETVVNGRRYIMIHRQFQITATQVGKLTIEGAVFTGTEIKGSRWGPSLGIPISRQSQNITLNVKDKPSSYVGFWLPTPALELSQRFEPDALNEMALNQDPSAKIGETGSVKIDEIASIKIGEPINRIITLKIKNIAQSAMPDLNVTYPASVRVYSDKPTYREEGDFLVMQVKQVIIPRQQGSVTLPSIKITWFNTRAELQQTTDLPSLTINIEPADILPPTQPVLPASISSATPNQNTVIESQISPGYWPAATAVFALLWLSTLALYWKKTRRTVTPKGNDTSLSKYHLLQGLNGLKAAAKANDALQVATQYRQWDSSDIPADLHQQIKDEIESMMALHYSKNSKTSKTSKNNENSNNHKQAIAWNNRHLLALLKKAHSIKATHLKTSNLKKLE